MTVDLFGQRLESGKSQRSATLSACKLYRYTLHRRWGPGPLVLWIMLNPSTADHVADDRTIAKVTHYTARDFLTLGGFVVANLYAYRRKDPALMWRSSSMVDVVGPDNDRHLRELLATHERVVCAWGGEPRAAARASVVVGMAARAGRELLCLGKNMDGSPRHPLYLKKSQPFEVWRSVDAAG